MEGDLATERKRFSAIQTDEDISPRSEPGPLSPSRTTLPPLVTSPPSKAKLDRQSAYMSKRLSTFSNTSVQPSVRSRPTSTAFPIFHSSLPYSLVRDFAYGPLHPLFYGPLPEQPSTSISTPASEVSRRLSDPPPVAWQDRGGWAAGAWDPEEQLPQTTFVDGPPWSEDEDIHSPIVTSHSRHKKHKSNIVDFDHTRGRKCFPGDSKRGPYTNTNGSANELYYVSEMLEANGSGDYITYPPGSQRRSQNLQVPAGSSGSRRDSHFATLPQRTYTNDHDPPYDSDEGMSDHDDDYIHDESRFSRDYQFTIASPEEEMHGRAVALFDFTPENDNELGLVEGQVILVSYRHGQGWLVAQDPSTDQCGLVPEEYVRLLRDIEGGWNGLMESTLQEEPTSGNSGHERDRDGVLNPGPEVRTPTQADTKTYTPVISTFSTSTKDLEPYPKEMLGTPTTATSGAEKEKEKEKGKEVEGETSDDGQRK